MKVLKIAAFSDGDKGGNPAGVWIGDTLPDEKTMQTTAAEVGFSETVFAAPLNSQWQVRYFSPETEVPFCGHATIGLGAALAKIHGDGKFELRTKAGQITVEGRKQGPLYTAALQSPPTDSESISNELLKNTLTLFGYHSQDLDPKIPPAIIYAGTKHLVLSLKDRAKLKAMKYEMGIGRKLMHDAHLVTILLVHMETLQIFHTRNPFASGGIYEDPATGAATAAFTGYLCDLNWPYRGEITVIQGEDMGIRSILHATIPSMHGSSVRIFGTARFIL